MNVFVIRFSSLNDLHDFMRAHSLFVLWYPLSKKSQKKKAENNIFHFCLLYVNVLFLSFVGILRL